VLDVGSGGGNVGFLAADPVSSHGYVLGVDRSLAAVERARTRADSRNVTNIAVQVGDPASMHFETRYWSVRADVSGRSCDKSNKHDAIPP